MFVTDPDTTYDISDVLSELIDRGGLATARLQPRAQARAPPRSCIGSGERVSEADGFAPSSTRRRPTPSEMIGERRCV